MSARILVVDDEKEIADLIEVYLINDGYLVYKFYNGTDALECIEENELDLAVLDIMLPDIDGYHICQKIREKFFHLCGWDMKNRLFVTEVKKHFK